MSNNSNQPTNKLYAGKITSLVSAIVNSLLSLLKVTLGLASNSTALVADGVHSLADLITDVITYLLINISQQEADEDHHYGHGKFETLGSFLLAIALALTAFWILSQSILRIFNPQELTQLGHYALVAAFVSILSNEGLFRFCKHWGEKVNSPLIIANGWHHRTDSLSSVATLIGISFAIYGYPIADAIAALIVTIMLFKVSYEIGSTAFNELVESSIPSQDLKKLIKITKNSDGVIGAHALRARQIAGQTLVDVHIEVNPFISVSEGHAIAELVTFNIENSNLNVNDVTVHVDPHSVFDAPLPQEFSRSKLDRSIKKSLKKHYQQGTLHAFTIHLLTEMSSIEAVIEVDKIPTLKQSKTLVSQLQQDFPQFSRIDIHYRHKHSNI